MSSTIASAAAVTPAVPRSKREYPAHPLVGVGVVVFRSLQSPHEVLVVRRAKEPSKGMWSFPGGGLELGETIRQCAVREVLEETGVAMRNGSEGADSVEAFSAALAFPTAFAALDLITPDTAGRILYQYAIIEVAGVAEDPDVPLVASDDVDAAMWVAVDQLRQLDNLTTSCARFAEEAQARFCSGGGTPTQAPGRGQ